MGNRSHARRNFLRGALACTGLGLLSGCGALPSRPSWTKRLPRIGYLGLTAGPAEEAFRVGLRDLGYVEGENIVVEWRRADGQADRLPRLAEELIRLDLDVLVTRGTSETRIAKQATTTLPVVFTSVTDPVGAGLVTNLARPESNVTGISNSVTGLHSKRLELLNQTVPGASCIAVLSYFSVAISGADGVGDAWQETRVAAEKLGVQVQAYDDLAGADLDDVYAAVRRDRADALILLPSGPVFLSQPARLAEPAAQARIPSMFEATAFALAGGLLAYGADLFDVPRRSATYVDRILKGAKPADLPVERPTKFDFAINLKTAQALSLSIPQSILAQATEVIQ